MNAFRRWVLVLLPVLALAATTLFLVSMKRGSHGGKDSADWLVWYVLMTPLYAMGAGSGARRCRWPRWLGGR